MIPCFNNIITMSNVEIKLELSQEQREEVLRTLKARFEKNMNRHKGLEWAKVQAKMVHPLTMASEDFAAHLGSDFCF